MNFVEEFCYFVEEDGLATFIELETTIWDPWLVKQEGIINKQVLVGYDKPYLVTIIINWESPDNIKAADGDASNALEDEFQEKMEAAGFTYELISSDFFYSHNSILDGEINTLDDEDDDEDDSDDEDDDEDDSDDKDDSDN